MDARSYSRLASGVLLAAVIGLHVTIFFWPESWSRPNFLLNVAHDAQVLSTIALILAWVVLGPGWLWVRLLAAPAAGWLWYLALAGALQSREITAGFIGAYVFCLAVLVIAARVVGLRVTRLEARSGLEPGAQFSLTVLVVVTTLIAVAIGGLEGLRPVIGFPTTREYGDMDNLLSLDRSSRVGEQVRQLVAAAFLSLAAIGGVWTAMRPGAPWVRLAANVVLMLAAGLYLAHLSGATGTYRGLSGVTFLMPTAASLAVAFLVTGGMAALSLLPLRFMSYRLVRTLPALCPTPVPVDRRIQLVKQSAGVLLAATVFGMICFGGLLTDDGSGSGSRINWNTLESRPLFDTHDVVSPLNALGQWTDQGTVSTWDLPSWQVLSIKSAGGGLDSLTPMASAQAWGGMLSPNEAYGLDPAETPLPAPTSDQLEEISKRLQK